MRYILIIFFVLLFPLCAHADCSNPDSVAGGMIYNSDYQTMQFCDGAQWWSMKGDTMGPIRIAPGNNATCNSSMEGGLRYNSTSKVVEFCNGNAWESIILASGTGTPSTPPATAGYFVITNGTYNGLLGGMSGGNSKCLTDLQNNNWNGKTDATTRGIINSTHVRAWLCDGSACQDAVAGASYYFAVSGDATKGGASFTANAGGKGPGNTQDWSGTNYFDGAKIYWSGRDSDTGDSVWSSNNLSTSIRNCFNWNNSGSQLGAGVGTANSTTSARWSFNSGPACASTTPHLVCFVDP